MTFFHNLNKRLAELSAKQDLHESKVAESEKWIQKAVDPAHKGNLHKALHVAQGEKIPKAKIEKATHSKNPKLRHMAQFAKNVAKEGEEMADEGNAFTGALAKTPKGGKFKVGGKEFTDTSDLDEGFKEMDAWLAQREKEKGTGKFDKKERTLPGGMKATTYTRKHEEDEEDSDDEVKSDAPKKKGRPKSAASKDSERVTKGSHKYKMVGGKRVKKEKTKEDLDSDSVMMTRPSNMSSEGIEHGEEAEYNDEAGMAKDSLHTIVRHAKELERALRDNENLPEWVQEKIGQIKGMMSSVTDYIISTHERDIEQATGEEGITMGEGWRGGMHGEPDLVKTRHATGDTPQAQAYEDLMGYIDASFTRGLMEPKIAKHLRKLVLQLKPTNVAEKAPPGAKAERMVKHIKAGYAKDGKLTPKEKSIAYATTWKAHNKGKVEEEGKPDFLDLDKDGNKTEPMKQAAKQAKSKKKEVEETTTSGSVAPVVNAAPKASKGMQFGKGVYESMDKKFNQALTESINVESKMEECGDGNMEPKLVIQADGEDAAKLMMLLKLAGLDSQVPAACPTCGGSPCGCAEMVDENSPDWPTNDETIDAEPNLRTYSGGLNGPKSTKQGTLTGGGLPTMNPRRQASMEESVELERTLFKTWQKYKG
jgi:hypothetical protein